MFEDFENINKKEQYERIDFEEMILNICNPQRYVKNKEIQEDQSSCISIKKIKIVKIIKKMLDFFLVVCYYNITGNTKSRSTII